MGRELANFYLIPEPGARDYQQYRSGPGPAEPSDFPRWSARGRQAFGWLLGLRHPNQLSHLFLAALTSGKMSFARRKFGGHQPALDVSCQGLRLQTTRAFRGALGTQLARYQLFNRLVSN